MSASPVNIRVSVEVDHASAAPLEAHARELRGMDRMLAGPPPDRGTSMAFRDLCGPCSSGIHRGPGHGGVCECGCHHTTGEE